MTVDIAKLIEMGEATRGGHAMDYKREQWTAYERALCHACHPAASGGGGLLERHAMLEEFLAEFDFWEGNLRGVVRSARLNDLRRRLRASEALPPGKGET